MITIGIIAFFCLLGTCLLTGFNNAFHKLGSIEVNRKIRQHPIAFFFQHFFGKERWRAVNFSIRIIKTALSICYVILGFISLTNLQLSPLVATVSIFVLYLVLDSFFKFISSLVPTKYILITAFEVSFLISLTIPISVPLLKILDLILPTTPQKRAYTPSMLKEKLLEFIHEPELSSNLDAQDKKLILSVISFKARLAREIMVPRVDIFCLDSSTSIREAANLSLPNGYSRIPVYKDNVDNILGVLFYKDILSLYIQNQGGEQVDLDASIENLIRPVLYAPETKKISSLLQEFKTKKIHLAIIVDEYGGTEGIVTIEDILEELVGEIADEHDVGEEVLFHSLRSGEWTVDAKMSIVDIEKELGISIPHNPEYDTIGGYVFHKAGTIPSKGWKIEHDQFELEVLDSSERCLETILVKVKYPT